VGKGTAQRWRVALVRLHSKGPRRDEDEVHTNHALVCRPSYSDCDSDQEHRIPANPTQSNPTQPNANAGTNQPRQWFSHAWYCQSLTDTHTPMHEHSVLCTYSEKHAIPSNAE